MSLAQTCINTGQTQLSSTLCLASSVDMSTVYSYVSTILVTEKETPEKKYKKKERKRDRES